MTKIIKFAHLADLHLGGWREKKLTELNLKTFKLSIKKILDEKLDFVLFAGDIFNSAIPPLELVEDVVKELIKLKNNNIPLYVIGGSHDYSNSGKSFISLLEATELFIDVSKYETIGINEINLKFFKNSKLKINISGILGKKNGLDKNIYSNLTKQNLNLDFFNIFMFHCTLNDIKPDSLKNVTSNITSDLLPKGFDYYAGGHIHSHIEAKYLKKTLSYPGVLFPNNFRELITQTPSFNYCEFDFKTRETIIKRIFLNTYEKEYLNIDVSNLNSVEAESKINLELEKKDFFGKILLLEIKGEIKGKITDIKINKIIQKLYENGAYIILKNTYKLTTQKQDFINLDSTKGVLEIEQELTNKYLNNKIKKELAKKLLSKDFSKIDGEKINHYEERIKILIENVIKKQ